MRASARDRGSSTSPVRRCTSAGSRRLLAPRLSTQSCIPSSTARCEQAELITPLPPRNSTLRFVTPATYPPSTQDPARARRSLRPRHRQRLSLRLGPEGAYDLHGRREAALSRTTSSVTSSSRTLNRLAVDRRSAIRTAIEAMTDVTTVSPRTRPKHPPIGILNDQLPLATV